MGNLHFILISYLLQKLMGLDKNSLHFTLSLSCLILLRLLQFKCHSLYIGCVFDNSVYSLSLELNSCCNDLKVRVNFHPVGYYSLALYFVTWTAIDAIDGLKGLKIRSPRSQEFKNLLWCNSVIRAQRKGL